MVALKSDHFFYLLTVQDDFCSRAKSDISRGSASKTSQSALRLFVCLVGWLVFLTSPSATRLCRGRVLRLTSDNFYVLPHTRQSGETMTSVSAGHIILTPTQPVGSGRPQSLALYRLSYRAPQIDGGHRRHRRFSFTSTL